jgi:hypothetical protein
LGTGSSGSSRDGGYRKVGFSVRCLKD